MWEVHFPHNKGIDNDSEEDVHQESGNLGKSAEKKKKWMSSQKEEQPRISTLRKKEETKKNEEMPKNTTAAVPMKSSAILMKSARNDDYDDDNEFHAQKRLAKKRYCSHFKEKSKTQSFNFKGLCKL